MSKQSVAPMDGDPPDAQATAPKTPPRPGSVASSMLPFPEPLTSFVGRENVISTITALLRQATTRLVTLTGPGGVGKTRIALEVVRAIRDDTGARVGFIELAAIQEPAQVLPAIARALGVPEGDQHSLLERVSMQIGPAACLLALDNFEQVVDAGPVLTTLLGACPQLSLLITSRAVLRVRGEQVYPIPPLGLPGPGTDAEVVDAEAVRLFIARASEVRPDITLTEAAHPAIAGICARLDGLPLAIELAAARSNLFSPPAMLARLDQRLTMLTGGHRDQPARLRTMRNAIAWSYDLLSNDERALFRRLGVFINGFSLDAASAVAGAPEDVVLAGLEALVDQNLARPVMNGTDEPRYTMLETIREFALDELSARDEVTAARDRHAGFFLALAARADHEVDGPLADFWLPRLDRDRANQHAALAWLVDRGDAEGALRLGTALWRYWRIRGHLVHGRDNLARALALPGVVPLPLRAEAEWKLGYLQFYLGEYADARRHLEASVARFTEADDAAGAATALDSLGSVLRALRDFPGARAAHERALALRRELGDVDGQEMPLANLGVLALDEGDIANARSLLEAARDIAISGGSPRSIGNRFLTLARAELADGRLALAGELLDDCLAIFNEIGDQVALAAAHELLGRLAAAEGNRRRSIEHLCASVSLHQRLGLQRDLTELIEFLAARAVPIDAALATRMLAAANSARERGGPTRLRHETDTWDAAIAAARSGLGDEAFDSAWRRGVHAPLMTVAREAETSLATLDPGAGGASDSAAASILTPREQEILRLVAAGRSNREIAVALYISPATAKRHVSNILAKLHLPTRAAAIAWALRDGLGSD